MFLPVPPHIDLNFFTIHKFQLFLDPTTHQKIISVEPLGPLPLIMDLPWAKIGTKHQMGVHTNDSKWRLLTTTSCGNKISFQSFFLTSNRSFVFIFIIFSSSSCSLHFSHVSIFLSLPSSPENETTKIYIVHCCNLFFILKTCEMQDPLL